MIINIATVRDKLKIKVASMTCGESESKKPTITAIIPAANRELPLAVKCKSTSLFILLLLIAIFSFCILFYFLFRRRCIIARTSATAI